LPIKSFRRGAFKPRLLALLGLVGLLAAAACLPVAGKSGAGRGETGTLLSQAETAYSQGQFDLAADHYRQFVAGEPETPRLESILASYGLAAEKAGRFPEAIKAYEKLIGRFPSGEFAGQARFRLVSVHLAAEVGEAAARLAGQLKATEADPGRQAELGLALGRAQWLTGNYREAAGRFLEGFRQGSPPSRQEARNGGLGSLVRMDYQALEAIQQSAGRDFPGPEAAYLLLYQAAAAKQQDLARALAEYFQKYYPESQLRPQAEAVAAAASAKKDLPAPAFGADYDPRAEVAATLAASPLAGAAVGLGSRLPSGGVTLAAILPLSDKKGAGQFAQDVARGLELAVKELAPGRVGLAVLDPGGVPDQATRHLTQVAADPRVLAVVGPLSRDEAAAAAAMRTNLPLIVISQAPDLPRSGPNVFRLFLTPRHQAEALARHAVRARNFKDLGVIYPDDNYGRAVWAAFQAEAAKPGAKATVAARYSPQQPDPEAVASRLTGVQAARKVSTDYQAKVECSVLYLPDSPGTVARLLPLLAFHDITRLPILGSTLWLDDPDFLAGSSRYLQGAVIPAPLSALSQRPESQNFFDRFKRAYGRAPSQFAAYGYDAGLALIQALGQGADSREALRQALLRGEQTPGVTGPFSFDRDGEYRVEPLLLAIQERELVLLREPDPAGR
jgi:branched-chain amino acid transport system substrate-binding protein